MIRLLNQKFERLQTEIFSLSYPRRCGRIECDGEDQVDGVSNGSLTSTAGNVDSASEGGQVWA